MFAGALLGIGHMAAGVIVVGWSLSVSLRYFCRVAPSPELDKAYTQNINLVRGFCSFWNNITSAPQPAAA